MRLGFHYHVPALQGGDHVLMPGYLGCFVDALAKEFSEVACFLHSPLHGEERYFDYQIRSPNVRLVNIGPHVSVPRRELFGRRFSEPLRRDRSRLDALLLRGPSPLLPRMAAAAIPLPTVLLLVGNYVAGVNDLPQPRWRKKMIRHWAGWNQRRQNRVAGHCLTFVNSRKLFHEMRPLASNLVETRTTTLSTADFFEREDTCLALPYRLLYTGRMDRTKGLLQIVEALALLEKQGEDIVLDLVGWPEKGDPVIDDLRRLSENRGISNRVNYLGFKAVGPELFGCYKAADLFVIASQSSEGFPRTIWEAMAHSLPVVATRVGSIPEFLGEAAQLVEPNNVLDLATAIRSVIHDSGRRREMIQRGRGLATGYTLEKQVPLMAAKIREWAAKCR